MYFLSGALAALLLTECNHLCNFGKGYYEEQFCVIALNLGQWFKRCSLKYFLSGALVAPCSVKQNHLCNFERGHHEEHSCEVILNLDQWIRRYRLKTFLFSSRALAALLFSGQEPFVQSW